MAHSFDAMYQDMFRTYYPKLLFYTTRLLNDEEEAEDVVQEVFVDFWNRRGTIDMGGQVQAYLYRMAYTRALNVLKHRQVRDKYALLQSEINQMRMDYYHPHEQNEIIKRIENRELRAQISEAIEKLPDKCKMVFKLSYLKEMKNQEIADLLGLSLRTVEAHMYKALKTLRIELADLLFFILLCTLV